MPGRFKYRRKIVQDRRIPGVQLLKTFQHELTAFKKSIFQIDSCRFIQTIHGRCGLEFLLQHLSGGLRLAAEFPE